MSEQITCPYCKSLIGEVDHCKHLISVNDDFVEWSEYDVISDIYSFYDNYVWVPSSLFNKKEESLLLEGLNIKKAMYQECIGYGSMNTILESLSDDIFFLYQDWDVNRPGGSGTYIYFFIRNKKKVQWIFDEFEVFYNRLVKWERREYPNEEIYNFDLGYGIEEYFENGGYLRDLKKIESNRTSLDKSSISIVQLFEYNNDIPNLVNNVENKPTSFLFSYFFITLIKQSIHTKNIKLPPTELSSSIVNKASETVEKTINRSDQEKLDNTPLFKGLLGTAHSNLHPALILMIVTLYKKGNQGFIEDFNILNNYFFNTFIKDIIPEHNIQFILDDIFNSFAVLNIPNSLSPYYRGENVIMDDYYKLINIFRDKLESVIQSVS